MNDNQITIFADVEEKSIKSDNLWMSRCFDLARKGIGQVSPNPPVGAVLVQNGRILAEGYHHHFGGPHAEAEAINNVSEKDRHLIPSSTLYVSLEPCCMTRKTGPCTDLIIAEGIKIVTVSTLDPNPAVAGKGLEILKSKGITINEGILKDEGEVFIRPFTTNMIRKRPHILLKWAQSKYGYSGVAGEQIWLSKSSTKTWSHGQRATVDAIMVGARTIVTDNPSLTTRDFPGQSPQRVIYDPNGKLTEDYNVFNDDGIMVYYYSFVENRNIQGEHIRQKQLNSLENGLEQITKDLFTHNIGILLVEGGPYLQKQFIRQSLWDEAWVIKTQHTLVDGIRSPNVYGELIRKEKAGRDTIVGILNKKEIGQF